MPSRADELRKARESHTVVWLNFQRIYSKRPKDLYCFFEGQDDGKYFGVRIDVCLRGIERQTLVCDGKNSVLRVLRLIKQDGRYQSALVAGFVDADFDDNSPLEVEPLIYVTPCYSIENLYVSGTAFSRILKDEFFIDEVDEADYEIAVRLHESCMSSFCEAAELLNLWLFAQRQKNPATDDKVNLRTFSLESIISISAGGSVANYDLAKLLKLFPHATAVSQLEVDAHRTAFPKSQQLLKFRGKFLLECFRILLRTLLEDINAKPPRYFSSRRKVKLTLQDGNLLSQLSQYADTPPCLLRFLDKICQRSAPSAGVATQVA